VRLGEDGGVEEGLGKGDEDTSLELDRGVSDRDEEFAGEVVGDEGKLGEDSFSGMREDGNE